MKLAAGLHLSRQNLPLGMEANEEIENLILRSFEEGYKQRSLFSNKLVVKDGLEEVRTKIYELLHCDIDSESDIREQTNKVMDIFSEYRKLQPQGGKGDQNG